MKRLLSLMLCAVSLGVGAQTEYPYPYNPDGNNDGFINLSDLLDLLVIFNTEFSIGNANSDSTGAIMYLGDVKYYECLSAVESLSGSWRLPGERDVCKHLAFMAGVDSMNYWGNPNSNGWTRSVHGMDEVSKRYCTIGFTYQWGDDLEGVPNFDGVDYYQEPSYTNLTYSAKCFAVTEVKKSIEYTICTGFGAEEVVNCVNERLTQGWNLLGGVSSYSTFEAYQAMWRFSE
jgi:hypothetical protein